jgi:DNA-binding transcriptional regulator LsrR (DeoR family)
MVTIRKFIQLSRSNGLVQIKATDEWERFWMEENIEI